jgi:hypothetical protein
VESRANQRYELIKQPGDPDTYDEYIARLDPHVEAEAWVNIIVKSALDNQIVGNHVNNMKRAVIDVSAAPFTLLTSDRPVSLYNVKAADGMISMPISPTKMFAAVNDQPLLERIKRGKPNKIARAANEHCVMRARRFVWATNESQAGYIARYISSKMETAPLFPNIGKS